MLEILAGGFSLLTFGCTLAAGVVVGLAVRDRFRLIAGCALGLVGAASVVFAALALSFDWHDVDTSPPQLVVVWFGLMGLLLAVFCVGVAVVYRIRGDWDPFD